MTRIAYFGLLALLPVAADSQSEPTGAGTDLQGWSIAQLCDSQDSREVLDELERRDVFTSRELNSIGRGKISEGMSEEALRCIKGNPESVVPVASIVNSVRFEAFLYPPAGAEDALAVFVGHGAEESAVAHVVSGDREDIAASVASTTLMCDSSGSPTHCYVVDPTVGARLDACGYWEFPGRIAGSPGSSMGAGPGAVCRSN